MHHNGARPKWAHTNIMAMHQDGALGARPIMVQHQDGAQVSERLLTSEGIAP